ncbi:hypothetical protein V6N11_066852 [Hibiscus sabdariffa]|uniref:Polygalacturonase n=1 Tax=Hibiscus sabdariffa TaxID=183260 RepID=A0ABR2SNW8_9ROSI
MGRGVLLFTPDSLHCPLDRGFLFGFFCGNGIVLPGRGFPRRGKTWSGRPVPKMRAFAFNLTDFGGGRRWGDAEDAEILGIQDENQWPLMPPLPSYGHGREHHGPRYGSLIHGRNLKDVVITGHNGTINGQGQSWWKKYHQKLLDHTRGPLVQIMWSSDIVIANITLRDSPFWTFHPYDCKNVTVRNVTILAPIHGAPNTDGIDPDSCEDVVIEDCYISVGDDAIAIKSGGINMGIAYGRPSRNILVRNLIVRSMVSAGISIGSEMSGGVSDVTVENLLVWSSRRATTTSTPDNDFDPKALPIVKDISFTGVYGQGVRVPVRIHGSEDIPIRNVTFRDISVGLTYKKKHIFQCGFVQGRVIGTIFPAPCENLDLYNEEGQLVKRSIAQNITDVDYDI